MTVTEAELEFDSIPDVLKSPDAAITAIKNQIAWLEYVPESELTEAETERIVWACKKLYRTLRPLTAKYID